MSALRLKNKVPMYRCVWVMPDGRSYDQSTWTLKEARQWCKPFDKNDELPLFAAIIRLKDMEVVFLAGVCTKFG